MLVGSDSSEERYGTVCVGRQYSFSFSCYLLIETNCWVEDHWAEICRYRKRP
jgi:hypothetical protein